MHAAKQRGRACFEIYQPSMGEQASDKLRVLSELRGALARDELLLHYQPIFALETGEMHGVECLVRWQHPERGLLLPCDFLPAAEESGLILELGLWVLRAATRQAALWQETGNATNISVNLSVRQLLHPTLVDDVRAALGDAGLAPGRLTLEVTESALITDLAAASVVLDELHGLGIRLSLDDFGTGYCSLTYLRHLAVDELKLDRSFLVDLDDSASHAVIRAAIDMARALGMSVVGEGVERPEQLAALQQLGCGLGQGFLLGRPEAADDLSLLRSAVAALNNAGDRLVRMRPRTPTRRGTIARQT
jgi:EAL domain-containing protein (putative c-di-GMP-specific phosphodiesterase class I)